MSEICDNCGKSDSIDNFYYWRWGKLCLECNQNFYICGVCGKIFSKRENPPLLDVRAGQLICPSCSKKLTTCKNCGNKVYFTYNGICLRCLEEDIFECEECKKMEKKRYQIYWEGRFICEECLRT